MSLDQIYLKTLSLEQSEPVDTRELIDYLDWLEDSSKRYGALSEQGLSEAECLTLYTRIAHCVLNWVVRSWEHPDRNVIEAFAARKTLLWSVFQASVYRGQGILLERAARYGFTEIDADPKPQIELTGSTMETDALLRLMAVVSINDASEAIVRQGLLEVPEIAFALWLGWTGERIRVTDRAMQAEQLLLDFTIDRAAVGIPRSLMECATSAYMYFTYMVHEQKHDMKAHLNRCFEKTLHESELIVPELSIERIPRARPKMIIPLERFVSGHAMHRCYAEYIAWLRDEFETIALVNAKDIDEQSGAIFDRIIQKETNWNMQDVVNIVSMESPDIIYYPSIGMNTWVIMMSNIRLAPVQVMTCGHPATSTSSQIDFVYRPYSDLIRSPQDHFQERVIWGKKIRNVDPWCPYVCNTHVLEENNIEVKSQREISANRVVGVNCKIMKLNACFLEMLRATDELNPKLKWSFYPAEKGFGYDAINVFLKKLFDDVDVAPYQPYVDFLRSLSEIDVSLVPFPFGNTNSTIDALTLNKPVVCLLSDEPEMAGDILILERLGLDHLMLASSLEQYLQLTNMLLGDHNKEQADHILEEISRLDWRSILSNSSASSEQEMKAFVEGMRFLVA